MDKHTKAIYKRGAVVVIPVMLFVGCRVGLRACAYSVRHDHSVYVPPPPIELPTATPTTTTPRPKVTTAADGFTSKDLATAQALPDDLVVTPTHVGWIRTRTSEVVVVPRAGGDQTVVAKSLAIVKRRHAQALALSATHAYWITQEGADMGRVQRAPLAGGDVETIADNMAGLTAIAFDKNNDVYVAVKTDVMNELDAGTHSGIYKIAPNKKPALVWSGDSPCAIAIDDKAIYTVEEMGVTRIPKTGPKTGVKQVAPPDQGTGCSVAVDDENVYWTSPSSDRFLHANKLTGANLAQVRVAKRPWNVVVDGGYAYVLTEQSANSFGELGNIYKIAVRASATSETAQPKAILVDRVGLNGLAANAGTVFFSAYNEAELDGTVSSLAESAPK